MNQARNLLSEENLRARKSEQEKEVNYKEVRSREGGKLSRKLEKEKEVNYKEVRARKGGKIS